MSSSCLVVSLTVLCASFYQRLSSSFTLPSSQELLFPSTARRVPHPTAASSTDRTAATSSNAVTTLTSTAATRKRKSPFAPSINLVPQAPHSRSTRSTSSTARGLSALFSSSTAPSPSPSPQRPSSPYAAAPAPMGSPQLYPLADYLLHIDADELATNLNFAEHLAQHINDRLLHAHNTTASAQPSTGPNGAVTSSAAPSTSLSASDATTATSSSASSSSLTVPTRLPSLLSRTGSRGLSGWELDGGSSGASEVALPALTDAEYNAMLDELISSTSLADAVVVEGPALQMMEDEEALQQAEDEQQQRDEDGGGSGSTRDREEKKEAQRQGGNRQNSDDGVADGRDEEGVDERNDSDSDTLATPRMVTVTRAAAAGHALPPTHRQPHSTYHRPAQCVS